MASYEELFTLHSDEIEKKARQQEISGRGTMSKVQKIAALADEDLSGLVEVLDQRKSDLVEVAADMGLDTGGTKDDIQIRIADARTNQVQRDAYPDSSRDGSTRKPDLDLQSSYDTAERRREEIMKGADRMIDTAWEKGTSYVLLESLLPRDRREPLSIQPGYMQHHPDEILVAEVLVPQAWSEKSDGLPQSKHVVTRAQEAAKLAVNEGVSQVLISEEGSPDLSIQPSHRQRDRGSTVVVEIVIPHIAFRLHRAEKSPLRIWKGDDAD